MVETALTLVVRNFRICKARRVSSAILKIGRLALSGRGVLMTIETCYACDERAVTNEHAPPKCFFPEGHRTNLITVPSCKGHNNDNSPDVEYVRNAIMSLAGINEAACAPVIEKAFRSFDRRPALFNRTFQSFQAVSFPDGPRGIFRIDLKRLDTVMKAVVRALHYRDTEQKWEHWRTFAPALGTEEQVFHSRADNWKPFRVLLRQVRYTHKPTSEPSVFQYGVSLLTDWGCLYKLVFYEGFVINAWMLQEKDSDE
jgi:hypothetical protein